MTPQLFVLAQSHCLKIEINGKTEQSDFPEGFFIGSSGELIKILPSYGLPVLNHEWVYWRTYRERMVNLIELVPERLFLMHSDLVKLNEPEIKPKEAEGLKARKSTKSDIKDASIQKDSSEVARQHSCNNVGNAESDQYDVQTENSTDAKQAKVQQNKHTKALPTGSAMLRLKQVIERTALSRSTIYNMLNEKSPQHNKGFPKPVRMGPHSVRWLESNIQSWVDSRIAAGRL